MKTIVHIPNGVCAVEWGQFGNGRPCILLRDAHTGEPFARATTNIPEVALEPGEMIMNNDAYDVVWEGLYFAGMITHAHRTVKSGWSEYRVVRLTPKALNEMANEKATH